MLIIVFLLFGIKKITNDLRFLLIFQENNVQHRLLDLYTSKNMSMSLKLQILHALDQTTRLQEGLLWFTATHPSKNPTQRQTCKPDKNGEVKNDSEGDNDYLKDNDDAEDMMDETEDNVDTVKSEIEEYSCYQRLVQIMMKREVLPSFIYYSPEAEDLLSLCLSIKENLH